MSFIHMNRFPYSLPDRGPVTVQLDQSDPILLPVALIDKNDIVADPRPTKDLVSVLIRSNQLSVSITAAGGTVHTYVFSLQPNDLALQHCTALVVKLPLLVDRLDPCGSRRAGSQ
jgi:hypothetical protein